MSETLPERPTFTDGQYIGAADLNAAVAFARDETRRLALSGSTWGIGAGLALVELPDTTGGVQMFIEPGIAWDGYGRPVVALAPAPVTPDLFAGLEPGPQTVWLRYLATGAQAIAPGFQTCGAGDPSTRIAESYIVVAGDPTVAQRTSGVAIGGANVADPRDMLIAVDQNAAVVLDGSAPQQSFPDDTAVWLIPVGIAIYTETAGSPGGFSARSTTELEASRAVRRYMSTVAESVLAADGVLRLRDRQTDNPSALSDDALDAAAAILPTDLGVDPNNATRLIGNELVWVEGNLRVTGHARMFGTQLELRDSSGLNGGAANVPQFLRRNVGPASNPLGGQDLQICFDQPGDSSGQNRLTIGVATPTPAAPNSNALDGALQEFVVVRGDGRVGIGANANAIDDFNASANNLVVATTGDTGLTIGSGAANKGNLFFAHSSGKSQTAKQDDGFITYDHNAQLMTLGAAAGTVLSLTAAGQAVIGPANPASFSAGADQLIVSSINDGSAGVTIVGGKKGYSTIDFADDGSAPNSGFIQYHAETENMRLGTASTTRVFIGGDGRVGIGTQTPKTYGPENQLVVASSAGDAGVTIAAASSSTCWLNFGATGVLPVGAVSYDLSANRMDFQTSENRVVSIDSEGNVGIGTASPVGQLQVKSPVVAAPYSLVLNTFTIQALLGSAPCPLQLQPQGSSVGIGTTTPSSLLQVHTSSPSAPGLIVDSASGASALWAGAGKVAIGAGGPARTTLDVQGAIAGTGASPAAGNHLAIFENTETGPGPANVLALVVDTAEATDQECHFVTFYSGTNDIGAITGGGAFPFNTITYSTSGADYAEAVPRAEKVERIGAKKIVGVRAGRVSLATEGADALFVTSEAPAMLAGKPHGDKRDAYESLAFLGQVRVLVDGPVRSGELIVASGKADGKGRALALEAARLEDLAMIVGRAWESVDDASVNGVNAVVGPGVAAAAAIGALVERARRGEAVARQLEAQAARIEAQATEIERLATVLARHEPSGAKP